MGNRKAPNLLPADAEKPAAPPAPPRKVQGWGLGSRLKSAEERFVKLERWRDAVSRYLPGESDCSTCRFARIEGSRDSPGGGDCQGYDQTGCDQPLLSETYTLCESAGILLEGLMIKMAESGAGCPWQEVKE